MPTINLPKNIDNTDKIQINSAIILEIIPYTNEYLVQATDGNRYRCVLLSDNFTGITGTKPHTLLNVNQPVIVLKTSNAEFGYIIGATPRELSSPTMNTSDWVGNMYSGVTPKDNVIDQTTLKMRDTNYNFNSSRPKDALPGDWGISGPLGTNLNIGPFSVLLRASEVCGLSLFYLDNLFRQSAYNYEFWNALEDILIRNDNGENIKVCRSSPFPWEMMGMPTADIFVNEDNADKYKNDQGEELWQEGNRKARFEPLNDDALIIPRISEFSGYLGDLNRVVISCPDKADKQETLQNKSNYIGLSETVQHSNGLLEFRSNKGIILEKSSYIAVPKQLHQANDHTGDTEENYSFAGMNGEFRHNKTEFKPDETYANDSRSLITMLFDELNWSRYKVGMVSLLSHQKDWHISEEKETSMYGGNHTGVNLVTGKEFLSGLPQSVSVKVDERDGHEHTYYKSRSTVRLMDNGDIVIENGHGSSIQLTDQNIILDCAGDILLKNGRNVTVMSPNDINLRAGGHVDVSADTGDMRLKAERGLYAHTNTQGIMFETRSLGNTQLYEGLKGSDVRSSGIVFKAPRSDVDVYGSNVYVNSVGGNVTLDANYGNGILNLFSDQQISIARNNNLSLVGTTPDNPENTQARHFNISRSMVSSDIQSVNVAGRFVCDSIITGRLSEDPKSATRNTNQQNSLNRMLKTNTRSIVLAAGSPYTPGSVKRDISKSICFTFRTSEQQGIDFSNENFLLFYESRWQQYYRINGIKNTWKDSGVKPLNSDGTEIDEVTCAFPGAEVWFDQERFGKYDFKYWDAKDGDVVDLLSYNGDNEHKIDKCKLNENYVINYQGV